MANKPNSIQFLKSKFIMIQWLLNRDEISKTQADEFLNQFVEEAEEMHKQEIDSAYFSGWDAFAKRNPLKIPTLEKK
jgi:hypothetical protein